MKINLLTVAFFTLFLGGMFTSSAQLITQNNSNDIFSTKTYRILVFNPSIEPNFDEIKEATYEAFFEAVSDKSNLQRIFKTLNVDSTMDFDEVDLNAIKDYCKNNDTEYALVSKVKYFKVGLGKYVFSNQVEVSMHLFDANGQHLTTYCYNTYKKNRKLLGTTENFVKIGTKGSLKLVLKSLRKSLKNS